MSPLILTAVIFQNLMSSVYAVQTKVAAKSIPKAQWPITLWTFVFMNLAGITIALSLGDVDFMSLFVPNILILYLINGFCFGVGTGALYYSYEKIDTAIVQILSTLRIPFIVLLSLLFLDQSLSVLGFLGIALVCLSVILVSNKPIKNKKIEYKAILLVVIVASMFAVGTISQKLTLNEVNISTLFAVSVPFEAVWVFVMLKIYRASAKPTKRVLQHAVPMGIVRILGGFAFVWLLQNVDNTSFVGAMTGLSVVFSTLIAAIYLKETNRFTLKIICSIVALIGIIFVYI